ncbi:hypothetical protein [Haloarcula halophila]|uniref:hypothetical protein n=1 Tax=Haloarcula TaxID=2237 RepID=UPI0023E352AD|nr:hypothetical protein [Halomicroarcula sp. DFY41]
MTNASTPTPGLTANRELGQITNLSPTIVLNNGNILKALVVLGLCSIIISALLAASVLFLPEPTGIFTSENKKAIAYWRAKHRAKILLMRAYISSGLGVLMLIFAASGFWSFYIIGGINILLFDLSVSLFSIVATVWAIQKIRIYPELQDYLDDFQSVETILEYSIYAISLVVAIFFYRYVFYNSLKALFVWLTVTGTWL